MRYAFTEDFFVFDRYNSRGCWSLANNDGISALVFWLTKYAAIKSLL
jgi:hypothetical protein